MRQDIEAGAMRHWRWMQDAIRDRDSVDIGEVGKRGCGQVSMRELRPFGPARGAAGVEKPGEIIRRAYVQSGGLVTERPRLVRAADLENARMRIVHRVERLVQGGPEIRRDDDELGARIIEDEGDLAPMQLRVYRHAGEPRMPAGEEAFDIGRAVFHHERDSR